MHKYRKWRLSEGPSLSVYLLREDSTMLKTAITSWLLQTTSATDLTIFQLPCEVTVINSSKCKYFFFVWIEQILHSVRSIKK